MTKNITWRSEYFYGNKVSDYGIENGYVDYATLAKSFDGVLANGIAELFFAEINGKFNEPEQINGIVDWSDREEDYYPPDIFQYYIISENGAKILEELTDEIVYYLPVLDLYVWGVTHYGTSWDYVLTDIKIEKEQNQ